MASPRSTVPPEIPDGGVATARRPHAPGARVEGRGQGTFGRIAKSMSRASSSSLTPLTTRGLTSPMTWSTKRHALVITSSSSFDLARRMGLSRTSALTASQPLKIGAAGGWCRSRRGRPQQLAYHAERPGHPVENRVLSSSSLTMVTSPLSPSGRSKATTMRGNTKAGSRPGAIKHPVTQLWAYSILPNVTTRRLKPVRYSRSADGDRKTRSMPSAPIRS